MNKGKHFTRVCLDCGKVMENVAGNLRFCASCRRERHNQYCRDYRAHNEKPARVMWYTVWDAKTGDLLASGTSEMCARRLGYKSANSFASAVSHGLSGSHRTYKYTFARERIDRSEVDSLPPVRTIRKSPPVRQHRRAARDDEFERLHHPDDITKSEVLQ